MDEVLCRLPFYLHSNGITVRCPNAAVGDRGTVNGTEYTKRVAGGITPANAAASCTSGITSMYRMFSGEAGFNGDISSWDVSSVTNMQGMFLTAAAFNQDISSWDVSSVEDMGGMFNSAFLFSQDISNWDVSSVVDMSTMFNAATAFNQDISSWDVSSVVNMNDMFNAAIVFSQDLSGWCVSAITEGTGTPPVPDDFAAGTPSEFKDDATRQPQWGTCPSP